MNISEKESLLTRLYITAEEVQEIIESCMDDLVKNGNSKEFKILLLTMAENAILLVQESYR